MNRPIDNDAPHTANTSDVISQLRLPLILLVTYAHSYSSITPNYHLLSSPFDAYEVLKLLLSQTMVKVAVPLFYVFSGYLFFRHTDRWNGQFYLQKMQRRAVSLLLPYLLWNLLAALKYGSPLLDSLWIENPHTGLQIDWLGQEQWLATPANMPLWFLRDLMMVSLLSPVIYWMLRSREGRWRSMLSHVVMLLLSLWYLSGIQAFTPGLSAYAVYFFSLGAYLSLHQKDLVATCLRIERLAYAAFIVLSVAMMTTYGTPVFASLMLCFRWVAVPAVVCMAYRLLSATSLRQPRWLCDASYFVYLAHYVLFFSSIDRLFFALFGNSTVALSFHYLLCPLLKVALLCTIYKIFVQLKRNHYLCRRKQK